MEQRECRPFFLGIIVELKRLAYHDIVGLLLVFIVAVKLVSLVGKNV